MTTHSSFNAAQPTDSKDQLYLLTLYTSSTVANIYIYSIRCLVQHENSCSLLLYYRKIEISDLL